MSVDVAVGAFVGTLACAFLVWAAHELRRRYARWERRMEERCHMERVGHHWGLPLEPGEDVDVFRNRLQEHVRGSVRYPREPG